MGAHQSVAEKSRLVIRRGYMEVHRVVAEVSRVQLYCSKILVADLKNKKSVKLTIDFGGYFRLKF